MKNENYKVMKFLERDRIANITLIESIKHNHSETIYQDSECVLIYDIPSETMLLSSKSMSSVVKALKVLKEPADFLVIQKEYWKYVAKTFELEKSAEYYQAVYDSKKIHLVNDGEHYQLLKEDDMFLAEKYYQTQNKQYLYARILNSSLWMCSVENKIVGFVGKHDDGSIGMLQVLPECRGIGYGKKLLRFITKVYLEREETPYSQISCSNEGSMYLHKNIGYSLSADTVIWLTSKCF